MTIPCNRKQKGALTTGRHLDGPNVSTMSMVVACLPAVFLAEALLQHELLRNLREGIELESIGLPIKTYLDGYWRFLET